MGTPRSLRRLRQVRATRGTGLSRQWNPECCGCEGGSLPTHQNGTEQGLVPAWCKFVPSDLRSEACRGSGPGCKCSDWCSATPLASQQWNPECCGCGSHAP